MLRYLCFKESFIDAFHAPLIHHQLIPMRLEYAAGFDQTIVDNLSIIGHEMYIDLLGSTVASLTAIGRNGNKLIPIFGSRRGGSVAVF